MADAPPFFCPECGLPPVPVEGKTYLATNGWLWRADRTMQETYEFMLTTTYICAPCRVSIVFPTETPHQEE